MRNAIATGSTGTEATLSRNTVRTRAHVLFASSIRGYVVAVLAGRADELHGAGRVHAALSAGRRCAKLIDCVGEIIRAAFALARVRPADVASHSGSVHLLGEGVDGTVPGCQVVAGVAAVAALAHGGGEQVRAATVPAARLRRSAAVVAAAHVLGADLLLGIALRHACRRCVSAIETKAELATGADVFEVDGANRAGRRDAVAAHAGVRFAHQRGSVSIGASTIGGSEVYRPFDVACAVFVSGFLPCGHRTRTVVATAAAFAHIVAVLLAIWAGCHGLTV